MDTTTPIPSTLPVSTPGISPIPAGGLNIDQMLGSLGQKTETPVVPVVSPTQATPLGATFSIDALAKPSVQHMEAPIKEQGSTNPETKSRFSLVMKSPMMRSMAALFGTVLVVIVGLWFMSVQYPIEAKQYKNKILGLWNSTSTIVQNNLNDTGIIASESNLVAETADELTAHSAAPVYDDSTPTPLADALAAQQSTDQQPTSTEQTRDNALALDNSGLSDTASGSALPINTDVQDTVLGGVSDALIDPDTQKSTLTEELTAIKTTADSYLSQLTASNKTSIARVVSKNAEALLTKLASAPSSEYESIATETAKLKTLVQKLQ